MSVNPIRSRIGLGQVPLPRPRLTVVPRVRSRAARLPFLVLVVGVLGIGLVGLLLLNTSMERGTYQLTALRQQSTELGIEQQALQLKVAALQDPQAVAQRALALGMVQNASPAFLELGSGRVIGRSLAASGANRPDIAVAAAPGVDRLAKATAVIAGEQNNAGTSGVIHALRHRTKTHDTTATSPRSSH